MATPLWSIWDNFGAEDRAYAGEAIQRPTHFNEFRCRDRTRDIAALASGAPHAPSSGALASDLQRRRTYWLDELDSGRARMAPAAIRPRWVRNLVFGGGIFFSLAMTAAIAIWTIQKGGMWGLAILALGPVVSLVFWPLFQETRRSALQFAARFRARQCPDCGHDFSGMPPAIDPDSLHGQWVGPATCPKCGVPWPMVPPQVVIESLKTSGTV